MFEKHWYCRHVMKRHFDKEHIMTKEGVENFGSPAKCWIWDNTFVEDVPKLRIIFAPLEI